MISSFSLLSHDIDTNEAEVWTITEALRPFNNCFSSSPIVESKSLRANLDVEVKRR